MNTSNALNRAETESNTQVVVHAGEVPLSVPQRMAMEWLMGGGSVTEAAQYAGVSRQTVSKWIHDDPDFGALFEYWQQQVRAANKARLVALSELAMDTLSDAVRNRKDTKTALALLRGSGVLAKS